MSSGWANFIGGFRTLCVFLPARQRLNISTELLELAGEVRRQALEDLGESAQDDPGGVVSSEQGPRRESARR